MLSSWGCWAHGGSPVSTQTHMLQHLQHADGGGSASQDLSPLRVPTLWQMLAPHTSPLFVSAWRLGPAGALLVLWGASRGRPQPATRTAWLAIVAFGLVDATCFQVCLPSRSACFRVRLHLPPGSACFQVRLHLPHGSANAQGIWLHLPLGSANVQGIWLHMPPTQPVCKPWSSHLIAVCRCLLLRRGSCGHMATLAGQQLCEHAAVSGPCRLLSQGFLAEGLQRTSAGLGSVIIDSQPLTVAVLASVFFGESLSAIGYAGTLRCHFMRNASVSLRRH